MKTSDWRLAWELSDLRAEHRRVLCALACSMGGDGGQSTRCAPTHEVVGRRSGYAPRTARRYVAEVVALGWLNVGRRRGEPNRYWARLPQGYGLPEGHGGMAAQKAAGMASQKATMIEDHEDGGSAAGGRSAAARPKDVSCGICGGPTKEGQEDDGTRYVFCTSGCHWVVGA